MNGPFIVARANTVGTVQGAQKTPVKVVKVTKPSDGQAITVELGHDQPTKVDLTAIANLILFDNRSTVTIEPYFASMNMASPNVTFEMSPSALRFALIAHRDWAKQAVPDVRCQVSMPRR